MRKILLLLYIPFVGIAQTDYELAFNSATLDYVEMTNASAVIANKIAFSIAESSLVKTAIYGEDANWGRIIMAIGKTNEKINLKKLVISIGKNIIVRNSMEAKNINLTKLASYMKNKIIKINVNMGLGSFNKTVWSSDLTHKYISINTDYRS